MTAQTALRVRVSGRVQGVGFRAWTQSHARSLGLDGWVKNEPDGSVSALISGPAEKVSEMAEAFHIGPRWAAVTRVETSPANPVENPSGFRIVG